MRIVYENKYSELDESDAAEKKSMSVRVSVGGFGVEKVKILEMLADLSDKVLEMAVKDTEIELEDDTEDMQIDSIHDKFETGTERKGWFR